MTDMNIQNFTYFLNELGKNLRDLDFLIEGPVLGVVRFGTVCVKLTFEFGSLTSNIYDK